MFALHRSLYGDIANTTLLGNSSLSPKLSVSNTSGLDSVKFYEKSYYWFVQRFYQFNTLSTNSVSSAPSLTTNKALNFEKSISSYTNSVTSLNAQFALHNQLPSSSLDDVISEKSYSGINTTSPVSDSDLFLSYYDYSLWSKTRLEIAQNILKQDSNGPVKFYTPRNL